MKRALSVALPMRKREQWLRRMPILTIPILTLIVGTLFLFQGLSIAAYSPTSAEMVRSRMTG